MLDRHVRVITAACGDMGDSTQPGRIRDGLR
jgi:hypothetical protein